MIINLGVVLFLVGVAVLAGHLAGGVHGEIARDGFEVRRSLWFGLGAAAVLFASLGAGIAFTGTLTRMVAASTTEYVSGAEAAQEPYFTAAGVVCAVVVVVLSALVGWRSARRSREHDRKALEVYGSGTV